MTYNVDDLITFRAIGDVGGQQAQIYLQSLLPLYIILICPIRLRKAEALLPIVASANSSRGSIFGPETLQNEASKPALGATERTSNFYQIITVCVQNV